MGINDTFRASTRAGSQNQVIYWALAVVAAAVVVWMWWGHRKEAKPLPGTKIARTQKAPSAAAPIAARPVKTVLAPVTPPIVPPANTARAAVPTQAPPPVRVVSRIENSPAEPPPQPAPKRAAKILEAQLALVHMGISPGSLDGIMGSQTRAALRVFQQKAGLACNGTIDPDTEARLLAGPVSFTNYMVSEADLVRLLPLANTWLGKSQQERLDYETILECVAEKFHAHPSLIRQLNPGVDWGNVAAGTSVIVPNAEYPPPTAKAASVKIYLGSRCLEAFDAENN